MLYNQSESHFVLVCVRQGTQSVATLVLGPTPGAWRNAGTDHKNCDAEDAVWPAAISIVPVYLRGICQEWQVVCFYVIHLT